MKSEEQIRSEEKLPLLSAEDADVREVINNNENIVTGKCNKYCCSCCSCCCVCRPCCCCYEKETDPIKLKKKRIIQWSITGSIIGIFCIAIVSILCWIFVDESYYVDLNSVIENGNIVFEDTFEFDTLDTTLWEQHGNPGIRRGGIWNMSQVFIENKNLIIRTEKKEDGYYYNNGIQTKKKFTYGYFEVNCKLPKGMGIWAAFWLLYPDYVDIHNLDAHIGGAEMDVFESPWYPAKKVPQTIHIGSEQFHPGNYIQNPKWIFNSYKWDLYNDFNTYGLFWNEDIYKFYVNRKCVWTTSYKKNVSNKPQVMILSVETGGDNAIPDSNMWFLGRLITENPPEAFPLDFIVDYVRAYDLNGFIKK